MEETATVKRWLALCAFLSVVAGCTGVGGSGSRFLPENSAVAASPHLRVAVTMRIPRHRRGERTPVHPSTISSHTQSVGIAVNGGPAHVFNATIASPDCSAGASGRTCTFSIDAPGGNDTFVVTTLQRG